MNNKDVKIINNEGTKNKIKVIIADDAAILVDNIKKILEKDDRLDVLGVAYNGTEEYEKILEMQPDIVITDNQMPGLNGIDVIEKVVNSNIENKPCFIIITGDASDYDFRTRANNLKVYNILRKPIDERMLKNAIEECIFEKEHKEEQMCKNELLNNNKQPQSILKMLLRFLKHKNDF